MFLLYHISIRIARKMLDDYNLLDQFKIPLCFGYYQQLFNRISTRELKPNKQQKNKLLLLANHNYLPFVFFDQLLKQQGIDSELIVGESDKTDSKTLIISNFSSKNATKISAKEDQPIFCQDLEVLLKLAKLTDQHGLTDKLFNQLRTKLKQATSTKQWGINSVLTDNLAKQIALFAVGKNNLFISSTKFSSLGLAFAKYWQLNAKNVAFYQTVNDLAAFGALGWTKQPVDKQFAVFDLMSKLDHKDDQQLFVAKNRLLSGQMPASKIYFLKGKTNFDQLVHGLILAQIASFYLASLNKVRPDKDSLLSRF